MLDITGAEPLYIIKIAPDAAGSYVATFQQRQMPVAGLPADPPAVDLPDALRELASELPEVAPDQEIPFFPSVMFVITVNRDDEGDLVTALIAAGSEQMLGQDIPIPVGLAAFIRALAEQIETKIGLVG